MSEKLILGWAGLAFEDFDFIIAQVSTPHSINLFSTSPPSRVRQGRGAFGVIKATTPSRSRLGYGFFNLVFDISPIKNCHFHPFSTSLPSHDRQGVGAFGAIKATTPSRSRLGYFYL
jgi:hypothetical protein